MNYKNEEIRIIVSLCGSNPRASVNELFSDIEHASGMYADGYNPTAVVWAECKKDEKSKWRRDDSIC